MKQTSWVIALFVGLVLGIVGDRMSGGGAPAGKKLDLPPGSLRESDLPPGTLTGLSEAQKVQVLKGVTDKYGRAAPSPAPRPSDEAKTVYRIPLEDSPAHGPADALVTVVEVSDFECPFCKRATPTMKQLDEAYPGKLRFVFKHNPLPFHPKALPSAVAAEEARAEGGDAKFWAMHDALFESNPALDRPALEKIGQQLGLNAAALAKALDEQRYGDRIKRDQALAQSVGANGTPTFFINGRMVVGAQPLEAFKAVVDEELKKADDLVKSGVPARDVYARIIEKGATAAPAPAAPQAPRPPPPPAASRVDFRPDDPVKGPKVAKVTVVEFSDFQCPFCVRVEPTLKQLEDTYPKDVRVVWKHQPLPFHQQAMPAATAAEAAREQGKFWQMHDLLFENQQSLGTAKYDEWASRLGLDARKFSAARGSDKTRTRIQEDMQLGAKVGANGTPTLFVNCRQIIGAQPYENFKKMVDEELAKADQLQKQGVKLDGKFYDRICEANVKAVGRN